MRVPNTRLTPRVLTTSPQRGEGSGRELPLRHAWDFTFSSGPQFRGPALFILPCSLPSSLHNAAILKDEDLVSVDHS